MFERIAFATAIALLLSVIGESGSAFVAAHQSPWRDGMPHRCVHDTHIVPQMRKEDEEFAARGETRPDARIAHPDGREAQVLAVGNIRFVIRTTDLYDASKYCTAASGSVKDMYNSGTTIACSTTDDILTSAKRDLLVNTIIPAAVEQLSYAYSVTQTTGNIMVPSTSVCGSDWGIPSADVTTGVANADYVLYVAASPIAGSTIAFAGYCALSGGRPVVGRMNFQPKYIEWNTSDPFSIEKARRTAMHELSHALGFSSSLFLSTPVSGSRRGKSISEVQGTKTVGAVRDLTGCSTITGAEIEDEGGAGTTGSHLEARTFKDSLMTGVIGESRFDKIVLSIFDDSGVYTVNYSVAEFMVWGNNSYTGLGCGFTDNKCGVAAAGLGDWCGDYPCPFCDQETNTSMISQDRRWSGYCTYRANLGVSIPASYQNFALTTAGGSGYTYDLADYTTYVGQYSNRVCDDITTIPSASEVVYGWTFCKNCRAISSIDLVQNTSSLSAREARCIEFRCKSSNNGASWFLQFRVQYDTWISCNTDGTFGPITVTGGYTGTVECPKAATICNNNYPEMFLYDFSTNAPGGGGGGGSGGGSSASSGVFTLGDHTFTATEVAGLAVVLAIIVAVVIFVIYWFTCKDHGDAATSSGDKKINNEPHHHNHNNSSTQNNNNNNNNSASSGQYFTDEEGYQYYNDGHTTYWWDEGSQQWHACDS